jgi:hypothetical protein
VIPEFLFAVSLSINLATISRAESSECARISDLASARARLGGNPRLDAAQRRRPLHRIAGPGGYAGRFGACRSRPRRTQKRVALSEERLGLPRKANKGETAYSPQFRHGVIRRQMGCPHYVRSSPIATEERTSPDAKTGSQLIYRSLRQRILSRQKHLGFMSKRPARFSFLLAII